MYILQTLPLLHLLFIPPSAAQSHIRAQAPAPTAAPLFLRQIFTCDSGATSCHDGLPGCCSIGESCTSDTNGVPLCLGDCNGGPTCSGDFHGYCCDFGYTCNYQATLCESMTDFSPVQSTNVNPLSISSAFAAPSSVTPAPQPSSSPSFPSSSPPAPSTVLQPVPSIAPLTSAPQEAQSSTVTTPSVPAFASSPSAATDIDSSFSDQVSFSLPSGSAESSSTSSITKTSLSTPGPSNTATPTVEQPTPVITVVKSNAGRRIFDYEDGHNIARLGLLTLVLANNPSQYFQTLLTIDKTR